MSSFALGMLVGGLVTLLVLVIMVRVLTRGVVLPAADTDPGLPDLTLNLSRELLERLIDDGLQGVNLPLVTLRDPRLELETGGILVLRLRGDTVLLGAQPIVLRMRLRPDVDGVQIVTESADVGVFGNIAGPITASLDEQINAELAQRLAFAQQFEILEVGGTTSEVMVQARLKE